MDKNSEKNNVVTQKNQIEIQKSLNEIQQNTDAELTSIITSELSGKGKIVKASEIKKTVNDLTLDTNLLYKKCEDLYELGDTKYDMMEKLLLYIKNNESKFKIFSKVAEQILNESEYDKNDN